MSRLLRNDLRVQETQMNVSNVLITPIAMTQIHCKFIERRWPPCDYLSALYDEETPKLVRLIAKDPRRSRHRRPHARRLKSKFAKLSLRILFPHDVGPKLLNIKTLCSDEK